MAAMTKRERQYKHVLERVLAQGKPLRVAEEIAARVVNKTRARLGRQGRGPRLVSHGGGRQQWYPGKGRVAKSRARFYCLTHRRRFKTRAALAAHYRSRLHRRRGRAR